MKIDNSLFLQVSVGGVLANFLFQYFNNQIWSVAIERSYFLVTTMFSHKELQHKSCDVLQEMMFQKGTNGNDFPTECKRGTFVYKSDGGWVVDKNGPILTQDRKWFFDKLPLIPQPQF